jgi:T5SS/PEP-CTERM-associated repeat protein
VRNTVSFLGRNSSGTGAVTVDGANSLWDNSGDLTVGYDGVGTLSITGGGIVENWHGIVGLSSVAPRAAGKILKICSSALGQKARWTSREAASYEASRERSAINRTAPAMSPSMASEASGSIQKPRLSAIQFPTS